MKEYRIITIPGDGIGPELMESTIAVLEAVQEMSGALKLNLEEHEAGAGRYAKFGKRISDETLQACHEADGILKSPVGDPAVRTPEGTEGGFWAACSERASTSSPTCGPSGSTRASGVPWQAMNPAASITS